MHNSIQYETPVNDFHGFDTIARMQENKLNFDAAGREGLISFIKACVASGINRPEDVETEAARVTGSHIGVEVHSLIDEYNSIHWVWDGELMSPFSILNRV